MAIVAVGVWDEGSGERGPKVDGDGIQKSSKSYKKANICEKYP